MDEKVFEGLLKEKEEIEKNLKPKQRKFCEYYIALNFNGTAAAIAAGYKKESARQQASRLLTNVNIAAYRRVLLKIEVEKSSLSSEFVTQQRMEILKRCMSEVPVEEWDYNRHEMVQKGKYKFDAKNALKALDALDKTVKGCEDNKKDDIRIEFATEEGKVWGG